MSDALALTEISLNNDMQKMQAISHNLANVGTAGYKKSVVSTRAFHDVLEANAAVAGLPVLHSAASVPNLSITQDTSAGSFKYTGNPLDLALAEGEFLEVLTPTGPVYTRQANLRIDPQGRLSTMYGHAVMGTDGEILLTNNAPVIRQSGEVLDGKNLMGRLRVVSFAKPKELMSLGSGMYMAKDLSAPSEVVNPKVRQGYLEASNVVMMDEMVRMMETVRHFEASNRVVQGYDKMMDSAINILGEF